MADKKITRQLSIFINGKEVKNSLGAIGREIGKVKRKLKEANDPKDIQKYKKELSELKSRYADVKEEINDSNDVLEKAKGHWDNLLSGFLSGNLKQAQEGLKGLATNIKGITKAAWAFITTPLGATLAAVSAIGVATKKWVDFNLEIEKNNQLVRDLTQESGIAVDAIRIRAEVLKDTFEVDIPKSVETAKSLVKGFKISYEEAFDIIEDGAIRGKLKNDEFLDSLKEYPLLFSKAKFTAQDFAAIVSTGIDLSIYTDKLPDAIKEFTLSVTEQTKSGRDALVNAFGAPFADKLLKNVRTGKITVKQALQEIAKESEKVNLNQQQQAQLTADLFKGAGEDAGGALKIFEAVNIALNKQKKPLTELQQIQKEQLDTNKDLNGVYKQLFASGSSGFNILIQKGKLFASQILLKILKGGVDVYNWFVELNNESSIFSAGLKGLGIVATSSFSIISEVLGLIWKQFRPLGTFIQGVFTFNPTKIKEGFKQGFENIASTLTNLKNKAINDANSVYDAFQGNNKLEKLSLQDLVSDDATVVSTNNNETGLVTPQNDNQETELTPEDKRILESKKKLAEFLKEFDEEQKIQKELEKLAEDERAQEEELLRLEQKFLKMEEEAGLTAEKEAELSEKDKELKKQLEAAKLIEVDKIKKKYADKRYAERQKELAKHAKLNAEYHKKMIAAETQLENARRAALDFGVSNLKDAFDKKSGIYKALFVLEKALAVKDVINNSAKSIAQITANTGIANAKAIAASPLTGGLPWTGINTAIAAKQIAATKIMAGIQIASIAASTVKGFKKGGHTGEKAIYHDEFGAVTGVVHDNEWVAPKWMNDSPKYAPMIQWLEKERKSKLKSSPGYFEGGNVNSTEPAVFDEVAVDTNEKPNINAMLLEQLTRFNNHLDNGIKATTLIGDDNIEQFREREEKLNKSRENAKIQ